MAHGQDASTRGPGASSAYYRYVPPTPAELDQRIEYDLDDQDEAWLVHMNEDRERGEQPAVPLAAFEFLLDRCEKEWAGVHRVRSRCRQSVAPQRKAARQRGRSRQRGGWAGASWRQEWRAAHPTAPTDEDDEACVVCGRCDIDTANALVFCDGCNLAVHQDCYGVPYIPEGPWLCRKCLLAPDRAVGVATAGNRRTGRQG